MRYPTALENADKEQYQNALQLLGAEDNTMMTPLWWAIKIKLILKRYFR